MGNKWRPEWVAENVIIPLASKIEYFSQTCPSTFFFFASYHELEKDKKAAANYLEYSRTPDHSQAFTHKINETLELLSQIALPVLPMRLSKLFFESVRIEIELEKEVEILKEDKGLESVENLDIDSAHSVSEEIYKAYEAELEKFKQSAEYLAAIEKSTDAVEYLRQLAEMMVAEVATDLVGLEIDNMFKVDNDLVYIRFNSKELGHFRNSLGMKYLTYLVTFPGQQIDTAYEFQAAVFGVNLKRDMTKNNAADLYHGFRKSSFLVEDSHEEAKASLAYYHSEIERIQTRLAEKDGEYIKDENERMKLEEEEDAIIEAIKRIGHTKTKLKKESGIEKLEKSIRQDVFRAIDKIRSANNGADLAAHFDQTLKPFKFPLSYCPRVDPHWNE